MIYSSLQELDSLGATDLFISEGKKISIKKKNGKIEELGSNISTHEDFKTFFDAHLSSELFDKLANDKELDFGFSTDQNHRYRLNFYQQRNRLSLVARVIPKGDLCFERLNLPDHLKFLTEQLQGLIIVTGPAGSGKSTTLAALVHHINCHHKGHIVTIEDPIEYTHEDINCLVSQREVYQDTHDFNHALKQVVRQSPSVIVIGEIRDLESIQIALSAALTGHLVITTMHTINAVQTIERIVNYFPDSVRNQITVDFSLALKAIISQRLVPGKDDGCLYPALEMLIKTPRIQHLIASQEFDQIEYTMHHDKDAGMIPMVRSLVELCKNDKVDRDLAANLSLNKGEFESIMNGLETGVHSLNIKNDESSTHEINMHMLLQIAVEKGASDLLITAGSPPCLRIEGELTSIETSALSQIESEQLLFSILSHHQRKHFELEREIDLSLTLEIPGQQTTGLPYRFRVNGFYQKGCVASSIRLISQNIPDFKTIGIPSPVMDLIQNEHGLILVTGPTGHGKSTTLACLIEEINKSRSNHIVTIEDPIEYVYSNKKSIIDQREINSDTHSFNHALKHVLRQDPDVILIGEMRDKETIAAALTAAETGHLVLATLHTNDAVASVDRIIDVFPHNQQAQIRTQLSTSLLAVVSQRLLLNEQTQRRVAAFEVMKNTTPIQAIIRDDRTHTIPSVIQTSSKAGMITLDQSLLKLYHENVISRQTLKFHAKDKNLI